MRIIKNPGRGYSGHEKVKMYQYDSKGKYLRSYESKQEVRDKYYSSDKSKRPLVTAGHIYSKLPDDTFISTERIGRDKLIKLERIANCDLCSKDKRHRKFSVYNLLDEKIAEFSSLHIASKLLGMPKTTIFHRLEDKKSAKRKYLPKTDNLIFKYA